jgi:uncharacterized protein YbaP (TraB family)
MQIEARRGAGVMAVGAMGLGLVLGDCGYLWGKDLGDAPAKKKTFPSSVWKVSSDTSTVYLAGSVHLLRAQDHPLPPVYDVAYADSDRLVFEVDMSEMNSIDAQKQVLALGSYPAGETVKEHISEETYAKLQEYFRLRGVGGPMFESMRPGMLALTISSLEYMRLGAMPFLGVDMVYFKRAKEDEKPVSGLETTEFQMTLFDKLTPEKQEEMLEQTLDGLEDAGEVTDRLVEAWRTGNAKALSDLLREEFTADKDIESLLLIDRNTAWIPKIVEILESDENAMVVVGTGHLVGRKSVVQLLRRKGYKIKQLHYSPPPKKRGTNPGVDGDEEGGRRGGLSTPENPKDELKLEEKASRPAA